MRPRFPRSMGFGSVLTVPIILLVLLIGDSMVANWVESNIATVVMSKNPKLQNLSVNIKDSIFSKPVIPGLLMGPKVDHLDLDADNVQAGELIMDSAKVDVNGLTADRTQLLNERKLVLQSLESGRVQVTISEENLSQLFKTQIDIKDEGKLEVDVQGRPHAATIAISPDRQLSITPTGAPPAVVPIGDNPFLTCSPTLTTNDNSIELTCSISELPKLVETTGV